jgi:flagellar basal body L-ring protein FlgH
VKRALPIAVSLIVAVTASSCAKLMGNLRRDLDDAEPYSSYQPTVGGAWTERGYLSEEEDGPYSAVGHSERSPASVGGGRHSWVSQSQREANRRDQYRGNAAAEEGEGGETAYSNTPVMPPPVKREYKNGSRATRDDFVDEGASEGSLWASDGQTNYYFTKNKVRGVGDIVTVNLEQEIIRDTITEITRTLSPGERKAEMALAQERIRAKALGLPDPDAPKDSVTTSAAAPARAPAAAGGAQPADSGFKVVEESEITVRQATAADIDVSKSLDLKPGETVLAEIVERYPNGNYKIRGAKKLRYKNGQGGRMLTLVGVARGTDIGEDDVIQSGKLYEYRLEVLR